MANIRFVKPPPDNRVRCFPYAHQNTTNSSAVYESPTTSSNTLTHSLSRGCGDGEDANSSATLHITTPKRRKDHIPHWDIFITSRPESDKGQSGKSVPSPVSCGCGGDEPQGREAQAGEKRPTLAGKQTRTDNMVAVKCNSRNSDRLCDSGSRHQVIHVTGPVTQTDFVVPETCQTVDAARVGTPPVEVSANPASSGGPAEALAPGGGECSTGQVMVVTPVAGPRHSESLRAAPSQSWDDRQKHDTDDRGSNPSPQAATSRGTEGNQSHVTTTTEAQRPHAPKTLTVSPAPAKCSAKASQSVGLSEVSEEEVASLPEVVETMPCVGTTETHSADNFCSQKQSSQVEDPQYAMAEGSDLSDKKVSSDQSTTEGSPGSRSSRWIGLPRRPYPMGPLRRSISEYNFMHEEAFDDDDEEDVSFFSRMKSSKNVKPKRTYRQEVSTEAIDQWCCGSNHAASARGQGGSVTKYAWTDQAVRDTNFFGGSDIVLSMLDRSSLRQRHGTDGSSTSSDRSESVESSRTSTPVEPILSSSSMRRQQSRDAVLSARLAMRRFALADPERMIISQELREKVERDIKKRKSSTVRKFSQFFNIQLGLNKEEDLI